MAFWLSHIGILFHHQTFTGYLVKYDGNYRGEENSEKSSLREHYCISEPRGWVTG